jgi:putative ABC transport system permease protein
MFSNYIKTALRSFSRNPVFFLINLSGLAFGLATCIVAGLFVKHEYSVDKFYAGIEEIYRVSGKYKAFNISGSPYLFTETIVREMPEVTDGVRAAQQKLTVKVGDQTFKQDIVFADTNFISFFGLPLIYGNPDEALKGLKKIVITETQAKKLFADGAIGKTIQLRLGKEFEEFEISAIAEDTPANSSVSFDFIIPLENFYRDKKNLLNDWSNFQFTSFVRIKPELFSKVESAMPGFTKKNVPGEDGEFTQFVLSPLITHHLSEGAGGAGLKPGKSEKPLIVFSAISIVILLLACFNFMNLTNAQSSRRSLEVGIRKVSGAGRIQLVKQFLTESIITAAFASVLGLGIAELSLFVFKELLDVSLSVFSITNLDVFLALLLIIVLVGILAGSYPAIILSSVKTISTFKKQYRISGNNFLTRTVLGLQFVLSIILISCAIIMWKQQQFLLTKDLGFNKDQVAVLPLLPLDTLTVEVLKTELTKSPLVIGVSKTSSAFTRGNDVSMAVLPDQSKAFIFMQTIDANYLPLMQMKLLAGENFQEEKRYPEGAIIVNEALLKRFNLQDSIGVPVNQSLGVINRPTIIGVVKDFHHSDLHSSIQPYMFMYNHPLHDSYLVARLQAGKISDGVNFLRSTWQRINPNSPFDFFFLDDDIAFQYKNEQRWSAIITIATGMAIFLSILGLLGLAMFTTEQRRKEVGIRKILGASVRQIVVLLSGKYAILISVSFVIAVPASYYLMEDYWLKNFAFKANINAVVYVIALLIVIVIVGLAVGTQTVHAALQNPTDTLKEE